MSDAGSGAAVSNVKPAMFQIAVRRNETHWENSIIKSRSTKSLAIFTLLIWIAIVILGRLIAYDHVWGSWSHAPRA